jgi:chloramphenicol-sensitive protein RarD
MSRSSTNTNPKLGIACAVGATTWWGLAVIYWKLLYPIDAVTIILYRIATSALIMTIVCLIRYRPAVIRTHLTGKQMPSLILGGVFIALVWGLTVLGVNSERVVQVSLGYFIEPIMIAACSAIFFRERLTAPKITALALVCAGTGVMIYAFGALPLVAVGIAVSFTVYAMVKKRQRIPEDIAVCFESVLLLPVVAPAIIWLEVSGQGALAQADGAHYVLLLLSGVMSAGPLLLFSAAAKRTELFTLGIISYLDPLIILLLGTLVYGETLSLYKGIGFAVIWVGLIVYTVVGFRRTTDEN